jgi:hypothetical protein
VCINLRSGEWNRTTCRCHTFPQGNDPTMVVPAWIHSNTYCRYICVPRLGLNWSVMSAVLGFGMGCQKYNEQRCQVSMSDFWDRRVDTRISALYGLVHSNFQIIQNTIDSNMRKFMAACTFRDGLNTFSGKQIFKVMFVVLFEYGVSFCVIRWPPHQDCTITQIPHTFQGGINREPKRTRLCRTNCRMVR